MKARVGNYSGFEEWLRKRKNQGGDGRKMLNDSHREEAVDIYQAFLDAKNGVLDLKCACGEKGFVAADLQPHPNWPREKHVLCALHAKLMLEVEVFFDQIIKEK